MNQFESALGPLDDADVGFVLIGGAAIAAHGSACVTFDLDVCYGRSQRNIERLVNALAPYHPRPRGAPADLPFSFDVQSVLQGMNFTLTTDLGDLDLFGEVQGIGSYGEAAARATPVELFGRSCLVLSLEGLIASKRAGGRARDLAVLPELEALRELELLRAGRKASSPVRGNIDASQKGSERAEGKREA